MATPAQLVETHPPTTATTPRGPRPRFGRRFRKRGPALLLAIPVPIALIGLWYLLCLTGIYPPGLLPTPADAVSALGDWMFSTGRSPYSGTWWDATQASAGRVLVGYALGSAAALLVGVVSGFSPLVAKLVEPSIHLLRAIPIIGWLPLAFVLLGFGVTSSVALIGLGTFFPVVVNTMLGVRGVDRNLLRVGRMAGAGSPAILRLIVVPASLPAIVTGLRIGMGYAWVLVIIGEWEAVNTGLGHVLLDAYNYLRYDYVIAAMVSVGAMGFVFDKVLVLASRRVTRWHTETSFGVDQ